jgi:hypothetical protein
MTLSRTSGDLDWVDFWESQQRLPLYPVSSLYGWHVNQTERKAWVDSLLTNAQKFTIFKLFEVMSYLLGIDILDDAIHLS